MGKPRKQTYTMDLFLKNIREQDIRQDQDVQRLSDQWNNSMMNELIITVLNGDYVPPLILGEECNSQMWVVDGLQRSTVFMKFRYGGYKITSPWKILSLPTVQKLKIQKGKLCLMGTAILYGWTNSLI